MAVSVLVATIALASFLFFLLRAPGGEDPGTVMSPPPAVTDTRTKVAIIALDGAEWRIIDPMIDQGQLPNLAALKERGAWGNMKSMKPMLSPLLWTTVATGKPPEQHGIVDFQMKDPATGRAVPVSSRWRRTKALWNIFTDVNKSSTFIAWWATWPAETVLGRIVSDRVAFSLFGYRSGEGDLAGATYPPVYFDEIRPLVVDEEEITLEDVQGFIDIDADEFDEYRGRLIQDPVGAHRYPVNHLMKILASARTYHAIALDVLERGQPDLFALYYQGIDEVCHNFAHYMPPKMEMAEEEDYARYREAVFNYYRYQDRLLGEILERLEDDTVVIVVSDHGFRTGGGRPTDDPPYIQGKPGLWHRRYGIVILAGPVIRPGRLDTTGLLDLAPTILHLSGLPVPDDMSGEVITEAIDPVFLDTFPIRRIPSYAEVGRPLETAAPIVADSGVEEEILERLRTLGYIGGPEGGGGGIPSPDGEQLELASALPAGEALVTGYLNEASLHFNNKDYAKAEVIIGKVLDSAPGFAPGLILASQIYEEQGRYKQAIETVRRVVDGDPEGEKAVFTRVALLYSKSGLSREGLEYLKRQVDEHPDIGEIHAAIGKILLDLGETDAAEKALLKAIRLDPVLGEPLTDLHRIYRGTEKVLSLEPIVREGLELNDQSVVHHNWMGMIYEWKGNMAEAEREFRRAIDLDPDYAATMANLGALYGRTGRLQEAVAILNRAVDKDENHVEAWVNLGAALGRMRRPREAIRALETARSKGVETTTLYNALALAYLETRQRDKALAYLQESLKIDPGQKDALELLEQINQSS